MALTRSTSILLTLNKSLTRYCLRGLASSGFLQTDVNDKTGIATLTLNRPPANVLNLEMLQSLNETFSQFEETNYRGLIITSSLKSIFTAGLDIKEMYKPDKYRLEQFWIAFQDCWLALYGSKIPTAALINGHAPAGGCVISTCCEYRVMLPNFTIGLNETQFGLIAPTFVRASFHNVLPTRTAEMALVQGKLFKTDEAFKAGLIDEVVSNKEEGVGKCLNFFSTFANVNPMARALTKLQCRGKDLEELRTNKKQDVEDFVKLIINEDVQKNIGAYLSRLQKK